MNYTVLVVDDEEEQRHALVERVRWGEAGFTVVGEAENGVEALDMVEETEPDLILTDIRMPMISGLELAARVRELRPATQIAILSGYDSFEYAREAIDYNIIAYLLKPISSAELSEELHTIRRKMDERLGTALPAPDADLQKQVARLRVGEFLMPLMLGSSGAVADEDELLRRAAEIGILGDIAKPHFCVMVTKCKQSDGTYAADDAHVEFLGNILSRYVRAETFSLYGRMVTLVVLGGDTAAASALELPLREAVQTAKRLHGELCTVGVSREFSSLGAASDAYFQAVTARRYTSDGMGEVRFIDDQEHRADLESEPSERVTEQLEQILKVGDSAALSDFIGRLYEKSTPENANLTVLEIISTVSRVVSAVSDTEETVRLLSENPLFSRLTSYGDEGGMKSELLTFCEGARALIRGSQKRETEILTDRVLDIIDKRYGDGELSLSLVSRELAVSPNYLSALVKKTKKKNFITLLTERRMRAAHDMLTCTGMRVLEVAEKCGYSDQHYFSYCFKKFYGESPNKIRDAGRVDTV